MVAGVRLEGRGGEGFLSAFSGLNLVDGNSNADVGDENEEDS